MRTLWERDILKRISALIILIILSGVAPRSHEVDLKLLQANRALDAGNLGAASENLAAVALENPWRIDLWEPAGHYALAGNNPEAAILYFKEAAEHGILSANGYLRFGDAYLQVSNPFTAIQIWAAGNQIYGTTTEALTRIANTHRKLDDVPALIEDLKALRDFQLATSSPSEIAEINSEIGFLLATTSPESAPAYLIQAVELNPDLTEASELSFAIQRALSKDNRTYTLMAAGQKLAELNRWDLAFRAFQNAVEIQPDYAEAWAYVGESWQHLAVSDNDMAYQALEKALESDDQSLPAHIFMSLYWQRNGNLALALHYLKRAEKFDPANPNIQTDIGALMAVTGDLSAAEAYYAKAIELTMRSPEYLHAYIQFCIRYNFNIKETALPLAREALAKNPNGPASLAIMGQVLLRLGDLINSERFLHQALAQNNDYAPAHLYLGTLYQLQGEKIFAINHLDRAIELAPSTAIEVQANRILAEIQR